MINLQAEIDRQRREQLDADQAARQEANEAARRARLAEDAQRQAVQEKRQAAQAAQREAELRDRIRAIYPSLTDGEFNAEYPALRVRYLTQADGAAYAARRAALSELL